VGLNIFCKYTEPVTTSNLPAKEEEKAESKARSQLIVVPES
jgi:hypothetical protein